MTLDLPSTRDEAWRWSDLSALEGLAAAAPSAVLPVEAEALFLSADSYRLVFVDGVFDADKSNPGPVTLGVAAGDAAGHPLASLATGAANKGWQLRIDDKAQADGRAIEIVHLSTGGANHLTGEVTLGAGVSASIVETFAGTGWANRLTRAALAQGANLARAVRVLGESGFTSLTDHSELAEQAHSQLALLAAGGADTRFDIETRLLGPDGRADVGAALLARGTQRHDANVIMHHASTGGVSHQTWRLVAEDRATCSVAGRIEVARHAQKTDAIQSFKGLIGHRTATVNFKPELEIYADDVKCAHGATVGELSRDALFYLMARGVSPQEARALLTRAFIADTFDIIAREAVRDAFQAGTDSWLEGVA